MGKPTVMVPDVVSVDMMEDDLELGEIGGAVEAGSCVVCVVCGGAALVDGSSGGKVTGAGGEPEQKCPTSQHPPATQYSLKIEVKPSHVRVLYMR